MADVITRFKLETTQYDSALRDAASGLADFTRKAALAGNEFGKFTQSSVEVARSFGGITTSANNAKDKVKELVSAFNAVAKQYNALTQEQQQSDFGKALAESMTTLKGRISEAKQEMNSTGGILSQLKDKFTINIDALKIFNAAVTAAKAALDVAKDAFFASETNVDDWGRTVAAAEGIYDSFLQTLNTGDFSGFISNIGGVVTAAKDAYNALDELQTRMTIITPERTKLQARATELKATIRRQGADSEAGKAAQQELRNLEPKLSQAFKTESKLNMNAFKALVDTKLKNANIKLDKASYDALMRSFSSDATYEMLKRGARGSVNSNYVSGGSYDEGQAYKQDTRNTNQKLLDLFTDEWRKQYSPLLNAAFSAQGSAASTMLSDARYLREKGGGSGGGGGRGGAGSGAGDTYASDSIAAQEKLVQSLTKQWREAGAAVRDDYYTQLEAAKEKLKEMQNPATEGIYTANLQGLAVSPTTGMSLQGSIREIDISPLAVLEDRLRSLTEAQQQFGKYSSETWQEYQRQIEETNKAIEGFKGKDINKDANASVQSFQQAAGAISQVGSALSSIEDPSAKVMGIVAQAIATIAQAYAGALATDGTTKSNIWAFIGAAAASVASMVSTISAIHSATGYAQGGVVKGNSYSGDNIGGLVDGSQFVGLNAGEVVLNAAQQSTLANNLQNSGAGKMEIVGVLTGENVVLMADRWGRRTGRGELLFGKNL